MDIARTKRRILLTISEAKGRNQFVEADDVEGSRFRNVSLADASLEFFPREVDLEYRTGSGSF